MHTYRVINAELVTDVDIINITRQKVLYNDSHLPSGMIDDNIVVFQYYLCMDGLGNITNNIDIAIIDEFKRATLYYLRSKKLDELV
jgi:hypothetical protein